MAISGTKGQGWRAIPTQYRNASDILTSTLAAFLFSSYRKRERDREAHINYYTSADNRERQLTWQRWELTGRQGRQVAMTLVSGPGAEDDMTTLQPHPIHRFYSETINTALAWCNKMGCSNLTTGHTATTLHPLWQLWQCICVPGCWADPAAR